MKEFKTFNILLQEEIDKFVDEKIHLTKNKKQKKSLNELFTMNINNFMKDIGSQEIDDNTEIDTELWDWFLQTVDNSMHEQPDKWAELLKEQKLKILCNKFFTKKELVEKDKLEETVKKQIRKFFTALQNYTDLDGFIEKISNLPSELLSNLIRYFFSYSDALSTSVKVSKKELSARIKELYKERKDMIEKIDLVSKGYQTVLDISKLKELYNNGLFFEDNILNRGVNEYVSKLLNHKAASKKIKDNFSNTFVMDMQQQSQTSSAYIHHIESIKKEEGQEFFSANGYQVGNRFTNEIEAAKDKNDNQIIDKDSVFKEPKNYISNIVSPWEKDSEYEPGNMDNDSADGGGSSSGAGGFGGGSAMSGDSFSSPIDLTANQGEELPDDTSIEDNGEDGDTPLPTDEDGFPVDFGSEETNPEAANQNEEPKKEK